jgi:hypothetical protein
MLHHLGEDCSANLHAPLSGRQTVRSSNPQSGDSVWKTFKSKNPEMALNYRSY